MACKGLVTHVNTIIGYCELDNKKILHLSLLKLGDKEFELPDLGSRLSVTKAISPLHNFFICTPQSLMEISNAIPFTSGEFINLLEGDNDYAIKIIIFICRIMSMLKQKYHIMTNAVGESLILQILKKLDIKSKPKIPGIISVSQCKSTEIPKTSIDIPLWSYGIQTEVHAKGFLFGLLYVSPRRGCLILEDLQQSIRVIIPKLCSVINTEIFYKAYVLIKNYTVFAEVFNKLEIENLDYIYVELDDIMILTTETHASCILKEHITDFRPFTKMIKFTLKRKSPVSIGIRLQPEYYLEIHVTISNSDFELGQVFLTLPNVYIRDILNFKEDNEYVMYYNEVKLIKNPDLQFIYYKNLLLIDTNARFVLIRDESRGPFIKGILNLQLCKEALGMRKELLSFEGIISAKYLSDKYPSKSARPAKQHGFGVSGSDRIQKIVFQFERADRTPGYLDLYLSNLEHTLTPLGLVPNMKVLIKNVIPIRSRNYLRSCVFTSFEIISYNPKINFKSPILLNEVRILSWGKPFLLGLGSQLPKDAVVWGKPVNYYITKMNLKNSCKVCKITYDGIRACPKCGANKKETSLFMILHATDQFSEIRVTAKDPKMLLHIFDKCEYQFPSWVDEFSILGEYTFDVYEPVTYDPCNPEEKFKYMITDLLETVNKSVMGDMEIKCHHINTNPTKYLGRAVHFYLDPKN